MNGLQHAVNIGIGLVRFEIGVRTELDLKEENIERNGPKPYDSAFLL